MTLSIAGVSAPFVACSTTAQLKDLVPVLLKEPQLAVLTITTGSDPLFPQGHPEGTLLALVLAADDGRVWSCDARSVDLTVFTEVFRAPTVLKVLNEGLHVLPWLYRLFGEWPTPIADLQTTERRLMAGLSHAQQPTLAMLASTHLHQTFEQPPLTSSLRQPAVGTGPTFLSREEAFVLGEEEQRIVTQWARAVLPIFEQQMQLVRHEALERALQLDTDALPAFAAMSSRGIPVDTPWFEALRDACSGIVARCRPALVVDPGTPQWSGVMLPGDRTLGT